MDSELACKACTFINERGSKICNACGKTLNAPSIDFNTDGISCSQCTYINPVSTVTCRVCGSVLTQNAVASNSISVMQECQICLSQMSEAFKMPLCAHIFCSHCAKQHFTMKITQYGINTFRCPIDVCTCFDDLIDPTEFFNNLKPLLKNVLSKITYEVYKSKIAILDIIDKPGFIRCPLCNHGFINCGSRKTLCPSCKDTFCSKCMTKWIIGHLKVSCTSTKNGSGDISRATNAFCPKCKYKYFLERGGCMHITCTQCSYEYCEFCFTKITGKGKSCGFPNCNKQQSLHGHHPRSCMYYVQEMDHKKLAKLLELKGIQYKTNESRTSSRCAIKVSVDTDGGWRDSVCNKPATKDHNNMCLQHFKWHLGELLKKHSVDVLDVMDSLECSCELQRNNIKSECGATEDELRKLIRSQIPYKKMSQ